MDSAFENRALSFFLLYGDLAFSCQLESGRDLKVLRTADSCINRNLAAYGCQRKIRLAPPHGGAVKRWSTFVFNEFGERPYVRGLTERVGLTSRNLRLPVVKTALSVRPRAFPILQHYGLIPICSNACHLSRGGEVNVFYIFSHTPLNFCLSH